MALRTSGTTTFTITFPSRVIKARLFKHCSSINQARRTEANISVFTGVRFEWVGKEMFPEKKACFRWAEQEDDLSTALYTATSAFTFATFVALALTLVAFVWHAPDTPEKNNSDFPWRVKVLEAHMCLHCWKEP